MPESSTPKPSKQPNPKPQTFHDLTSTYASRFGKNDDQSNVTDEERQFRTQTAAEGSEQYGSPFHPISVFIIFLLDYRLQDTHGRILHVLTWYSGSTTSRPQHTCPAGAQASTYVTLKLFRSR